MPHVDWNMVFENLALAGAAFVLALPIGWERHRANRPAGLRTFPIVAVATCAFVLIGTRSFPDDSGAQARIVQGLMTGIGFIGGGAILKTRSDGDGHVEGIATAASIWNTGAIGASVAFARFELAITLAFLNYAILRWLTTAIDEAEEELQEGIAEEGEGVSGDDAR